jgi:hypothetical protein
MFGKAKWAPLLAAFFALGCGKASGEHVTGAASPLGIPPECRGFPLDNLHYSPGGTALPNKCKPFDATTNNPFAVRCVDAIPNYKTRYPGDDFCILPPPPEKGLQIGLHPQGTHYWQEMWAGDMSGYSDDSITKVFEVAPGGEIEQTYRTNMDNADARSCYRVDSRMRVGSHHMATYKTSAAGDEGWQPVTPDVFVPPNAGGFFWNSQRSNSDRPASSLEIPDEDVGLGVAVDARQGILLDVHHFNTRDVPILREAWINAWWVDGPVQRAVEDKPLLAPVDVAPNTVKILEGSLTPKRDTRILSLFGHRHAWTTRFNAWVHRADGSDEAVYDSFNWLDVPTYSYDSLSTNPVGNPDTETDGAASGILTVHPGDELLFNCHVDTTAARAADVGAPMPTQTLVFGNRAFDAEMCILYAQTITATGGDQ